jgi:hypothetical protein
MHAGSQVLLPKGERQAAGEHACMDVHAALLQKQAVQHVRHGSSMPPPGGGGPVHHATSRQQHTQLSVG